jgi:hypothetical protein
VPPAEVSTVELGVAFAVAWAPDEDAGPDLLARAGGVTPVAGWRRYGWAWSDRVADGDGPGEPVAGEPGPCRSLASAASALFTAAEVSCWLVLAAMP